MKYLLTSGGISNQSIQDQLIKLLGKPISECSALCIPTAVYGMDHGFDHAMQFIKGNADAPMCELGWKKTSLFELTALTTIQKEKWVNVLEQTDVILVNGGDPIFLIHWLRKSGVYEILPRLNCVYVGMSAGSMALTPMIGKEFIGWVSPDGLDQSLGLVPFSIFPHLNHPMLPNNTIINAEKWAKKIPNDSYAIDDKTAISVDGHEMLIISEGFWSKLNT